MLGFLDNVLKSVELRAEAPVPFEDGGGVTLINHQKRLEL